MTEFCYKFISGYGSVKISKLAKVIDRSLLPLPHFYGPQDRTRTAG